MALPQIPLLVRAIALSLMGIFLLDAMGAIIKHLVIAYPAQQLSVFRNFFGLFPSVLILLTSSEWHESGRKIRIRQWKLALSRGLFVTFAQFFFYLSLFHLALATASTLAFACPFFVAALSVPFLGDRVGVWRWLAVAVGSTGVVLILRPGGDVFTAYALLPIGAALGYAMSIISVRLITDPMPSATINLYGHIGALFGSTVFMFATSGYKPVASLEDWIWIVAMGTAGGFGVLLLVMAYRRTKPSNLAPFDYFGIPFAFALGWIFFGETPFDTLFPGVILIVIGGLVIFWRERRTSESSAKGSIGSA